MTSVRKNAKTLIKKQTSAKIWELSSRETPRIKDPDHKSRRPLGGFPKRVGKGVGARKEDVDSAQGAAADKWILITSEQESQYDLIKQAEAETKAVNGAPPGECSDEDGNETDQDGDLTEQQQSELWDPFRIFDRDGTGTIDPNKLGRVMKSLGQNPTEAEVQDLINAVDDDGNGTIEFGEFKHMMAQKLRDDNKDDEIKEAFRVFDRDGNGVISVDDMSDLFSRLGQHFTSNDVRHMLEAADLDGDNLVTYQDFARVFNEDP